MAEITGLAAHGRRVLLRRFAQGAAAGAAAFALIPIALADATQAATVKIDNFTFSPTPLTVPAGATVTWVNEDDIPHSIYCAALGLHSHALDTGDSFAHRFDTPGTFDYICAIHPHMQGRIVVQG